MAVSLGRRESKKKKKRKHGSLNLSSTPRIKTHHSNTLLAKLDWSVVLTLKKHKMLRWSHSCCFLLFLLYWVAKQAVSLLSQIHSSFLSSIFPIHNTFIHSPNSPHYFFSSTNTPIFPGISFLWPDQSNLLASVPTQTSIPKTSIIFCGRCCLLLHLDRYSSPLYFFCVKSANPCRNVWDGWLRRRDLRSEYWWTLLQRSNLSHFVQAFMTGHPAGTTGTDTEKERITKNNNKLVLIRTQTEM